MGLLLIAGGGPRGASAQTPTTTIQNGSGDTRLELNYDGGLLVPGTFGPTTPADSIPATGAGTRLMWYPAKAAFRAGRVGSSKDGTQWNASKVGEYSVAFGMDTEASGESTVAAGAGTSASAPVATALGSGTTASGIGTTALGSGTTAGGFAAVAMGNATTASGRAATAMGGIGTTASGDRAMAMGDETTASGDQATAMGTLTNANAGDAVAIGNRTTSSGLQSVAMGQETTASGNSATAMGFQTVAATALSLSIGECNSANASDDNTLLAVGNGTFSILDGRCLPRSDALVLDDSGNLEISGTLTESSDRRLKTDIAPLGDDVLPALREIGPVRYRFENPGAHPSGEQLGLIAQEVRAQFPALVNPGANGMLSLSYTKFTAVLLKGLQEQQREIDAQKTQIATLRAENEAIKAQQATLKERVAALEAHSGGSVLAGLSPASALLVPLMVLGGLLGTGILWRYHR